MVAISGIYRIQNVVSAKCYIGSTCDLERRLKQHFGLLRRGCHHAIHLQRSYAKHGDEAFIWGMLEYCDADKLIEREQHYLDKYSPVFNSTQLAITPGPGRKSVLQYTLTGEFVEEWTHAQAAADHMGVYQGGIKASCYGKQPSSYGYHWMFKQEQGISLQVKVPPPTAPKYTLPRNKRRAPSHKRRELMQMDEKGNCLRTWPSLRHCATDLKISAGGLCKGVNGAKKEYKGLRFKYADGK